MKRTKLYGNRAERGQYGETKSRVTLTVTQSAIDLLDQMAKDVDLNRSELVEQIARGMLEIKGGKLSRQQAAK
ncbi:ribbon-helix-helix protein, CopG family [Limnospira platensis CENA597]|uniref:ribbon-helix-helix protein, CopG family n=1 Tax=Limnospira platensis TaxID=118562 RepID=UPI003DA10989